MSMMMLPVYRLSIGAVILLSGPMHTHTQTPAHIHTFHPSIKFLHQPSGGGRLAPRTRPQSRPSSQIYTTSKHPA
ncbi:hypothetical protein QBC46DRAFT_104007 [Diplogelasinospora grovesii]|uniref:Secreted protein n=1 Tax=Diplogelasinospora grovesii TaxID=303347 RepID=A0AAN6S612_9PEZI|nr:hypothetical protein QBC46DRAFT_104007 [Diplogelasinospora grovesii]